MTERLTADGFCASEKCEGHCNICDYMRKMLEKLSHYEDLEEQGRLVELPAENDFKRDELDRCIHRHCNKCDGYRKEIQRYKDLEEQGRLVVLPEIVEDNGFGWIDTGVIPPKVFPLHVQKYDGEILVFDIIACKNPAGEEGYYDTVSNRFYTDLGKALKGE